MEQFLAHLHLNTSAGAANEPPSQTDRKYLGKVSNVAKRRHATRQTSKNTARSGANKPSRGAVIGDIWSARAVEYKKKWLYVALRGFIAPNFTLMMDSPEHFFSRNFCVMCKRSVTEGFPLSASANFLLFLFFCVHTHTHIDLLRS